MHLFDTEVFYEDTDMGGIVYHANYLKFIERARSAYVRGLGIDQLALRDQGTVFVIRRITADYLKPARFEERLRVETEVLRLTGTRLMLGQAVWRDDLCLFRAEVELAVMGLDGRPQRMPDALQQALAQ